MDKKQFQCLFKQYMKKLGFRSKGNVCYKPVSDTYLIVVYLEHWLYHGAYRIVYGVIYEPETMPPSPLTKTDWSSNFRFAEGVSDEASRPPKSVEWFDYTERTEEEFLLAMDENVSTCLAKLDDPNYVLEQYRNNWIRFRRIPYDTVRKICRLAGLDYDAVVTVRDSKLRSWP